MIYECCRLVETVDTAASRFVTYTHVMLIMLRMA